VARGQSNSSSILPRHRTMLPRCCGCVANRFNIQAKQALACSHACGPLYFLRLDGRQWARACPLLSAPDTQGLTLEKFGQQSNVPIENIA